MTPRHRLDGDARALNSFRVHLQLAQRAIDEDRDQAELYERAFLDGYARCVFDITGLTPRELWPGEPLWLRPKAGGL